MIARQIADMLTGVGITRVYGLPGEDHMALLDAFQDGRPDTAPRSTSPSAVHHGRDRRSAHRPARRGRPVTGARRQQRRERPAQHLPRPGPAAADLRPASGARFPFVVRQGFNIEQLVTPITKWRARSRPTSMYQAVGKAVDEAMSGKPGPVYLELPDAVATSEGAADRRGRAPCRGRAGRGGGRRAGRSPAPPRRRRLLGAASRRPSARPWSLGGRKPRVTPATPPRSPSAFRVPVFTSAAAEGRAAPGSRLLRRDVPQRPAGEGAPRPHRPGAHDRPRVVRLLQQGLVFRRRRGRDHRRRLHRVDQPASRTTRRATRRSTLPALVGGRWRRFGVDRRRRRPLPAPACARRSCRTARRVLGRARDRCGAATPGRATAT